MVVVEVEEEGGKGEEGWASPLRRVLPACAMAVQVRVFINGVSTIVSRSSPSFSNVDLLGQVRPDQP